ncbi:MAG: hypothetical protein HeimC2_32030 [Candidatus Heimdallarchaeota archaeon LC_2]|nr:MAG: hypothetical protein HeimC2_32030 [Candidatus Heimdallarchaeota archaeon LC_2]
MIQETKALQSIYVGLDISKQEIEICAINNEGKSLLTFTTSNSRKGFHLLIEKLMHYDQPTFGVESTGPYSGNIIQFLKKINAQIVLTNPFQISRLRDVFSKSVKLIQLMLMLLHKH